jgi:hypothetical protein
MTLMLTTKRIGLGRIVTGRAPITHYRQFRRREQLELPHAINCPAQQPRHVSN